MRHSLMYRNNNPASDFEGLVNRFLAPWTGMDFMDTQEFTPRADLEETKTHYLVTMDLPGVSKDDVKIELHQNTLIVSGEKKSETKKSEEGYRYVERRSGSFRRTFTLPDTVDAKGVEANCHDGVLEIAIPKSEKAQPQQIKINEGKSGVFSKLLGTDNKNKAS